MTNPLCPYCGNLSELVTGEVVYPGLWHLRDKQIYRCSPCSAWVGCHDGTTTPLGRLANASLRKAKIRAHAAFDPLWHKKFGWTETRFPNRGAAYKWLAEQLGMTRDECHIGMFDVDMCQRVETACNVSDMTKEQSMSDIVERLNNASYANAPSRCMEAAREIERLRAIESAPAIIISATYKTKRTIWNAALSRSNTGTRKRYAMH